MKNLLDWIDWLNQQAAEAETRAENLIIGYPRAASIEMGKAVAFRQTAAKIEEDAKAAHAENLAALNKPQVQ